MILVRYGMVNKFELQKNYFNKFVIFSLKNLQNL